MYQTFGIDDKVTFFELYNGGYLPITCLEFVDPNATMTEVSVEDSIADPTVDDLYKGEFNSTYFISIVDVTVKNAAGEVVQQVRGFGERAHFNTFLLTEFVEYPTRVVGGLDIEALEPGEYTVTYEVEVVTGERVVVRQITFTAQ